MAKAREGAVITKLKKANAIVALLASFALLGHMAYCSYAYATLSYNPQLKSLSTVPFILCACVHGVLGMCAVFLQGDGTRLDGYWKLNWRTIAQRISASLIFPLLIVHLKTFTMLSDFAANASWGQFALVILTQVLFYAVVATHVASSFSKAFITLGLIGSREMQRKLDRMTFALCSVAFCAATFVIVRGELLMFLPR